MDTYKLLDISYSEVPNLHVILIGKNRDGLRVFRIPYQPYFYVLSTYSKHFEKYNVEIEDTDYVSINGFRLNKIICKYPREVRLIRDETKKYYPTYEANIPFALRYCIDRNIVDSFNNELSPCKTEYNFSIAYLDLEVFSKEFPNIPTKPIVSLCLIHNNETLVWTTGYVELEHVNLKYFNTEKEMLNNFISYLKQNHVDILVTFSMFDLRYLIGRMKTLKLMYSRLSPINQVTLTRDRVKIYGIQHIDYRMLYCKVFDPPFRTLDYIAKKELGYGKLECDVYKEWDTNPGNVIKYNIRDTELLLHLEEKLQLIKHYLSPIREITGLDFMDCLLSSRIGMVLHWRKAREKKLVLPTYSLKPLRPYSGAYVYAKTGLYHDVYQFDWKELYPSIMETFHISIDTKTDDKYIGRTVKVYKSNYRLDLEGLTNEVIKPLRKIRAKYKELFKTTRDRKYYNLSFAFKQVINAAYGLYGYKRKIEVGQKKIEIGNPLYDADIAESISLTGKEILLEVLKYCIKMKYDVVYGDTDSVFLICNDDPLIVRDNIQNHISSYIRDKYGLESKLFLEYQGLLKKLLVITKKRYVALLPDDTVTFKGLEIVRRDSSDLTVELLKQFVTMILEGQSIEDLKQFINSEYEKIIQKQYPLDKLGMRAICRKLKYKTYTENYKAMLTGNCFNCGIRSGERFYKYFIHPVKIPNTKLKVSTVIGVQNINQINSLVNNLDVRINYVKTANRTIAPLKNILEYLIEKHLMQTTLDSFLGRHQ